jgi:hypothetical protein
MRIRRQLWLVVQRRAGSAHRFDSGNGNRGEGMKKEDERRGEEEKEEMEKLLEMRCPNRD